MKKLVIVITILLVISIGLNVYQFVQNRNVTLSEENELTPTPPANSGVDTDALKRQIADLRKQMDTLWNEIAALYAKIQALNEQISDLNNRMSNGENVQSQINEKMLQIGSIEAEIQSKQATISYLNQSYTLAVQALEEQEKQNSPSGSGDPK
jgi:chromosome segregation ATPase